MSFFKDKYNTVSEFFKDIRRAIDSLTIRVNDLDTRRDELGVAKPVIDEDTDYTADELSVAVDSGTASISLSNGTDPLKVIGDGVLLSVDDNSGALKLSAGDSSVALGITVNGSGVASLALDNDTEPVQIVGGDGVTLSLNGSGMLQIDVEGSTAPTGATGISSSISGNSAIIELTGGSGSVQINGSSNVNITGSNGVINIDVPASTVTPPTPPPSSGIARYVFSAEGAYQLEANSDNIVYYPYPVVSAANPSHTHKYGFVADQTITNNTIAAIIAITGQDASDFDASKGFSDDYGNMIFILPRNPTPLCSVRICVSHGSTRVLVVSTEGKPIVAHFMGAQGSTSGYCTDYVAPPDSNESSDGFDYLYVYVTKSITNTWSKPYEQGNHFEWAEDFCNNKTYNACWVRINLN